MAGAPTFVVEKAMSIVAETFTRSLVRPRNEALRCARRGERWRAMPSVLLSSLVMADSEGESW